MDNPFRFAAEDPELAKHRITEEHTTRRASEAERQETKRKAIEKADPWVKFWGLCFLTITVVSAAITADTYFRLHSPLGNCAEQAYVLKSHSGATCDPGQLSRVEKTTEGDVLICGCAGKAPVAQGP